MPITVDVSEVYDLVTDIRASPRRVGAELANVVRKVGADTEATAKSLAAVDTGNMRNSIGHETSGDGRSGLMTVDIFVAADYGVHVEFGTYKMAAQPFMIPAHQSQEPSFVAAVTAVAGRVTL